MTGKTYRVLFYCFIVIFCSLPTNAALTNTPWVHVEASIGQPFIWSDTDEGFKSSASVNSGGAVLEHYAYTSHSIEFVSPEKAIAYFDRELSKPLSSNNPLGQGTQSYFYYEALLDSTADYSWNLTYVFRAGYLNGIFEGGNVKLTVDRYDSLNDEWVNVYSDFSMGPSEYGDGDGLYSGTGTFNLIAGNTYRVKLTNSSSLFLSSSSATLEGTVSFDFNGAEVLACEGDFDADGDVDGSDLAVFAADFGRTDCSGDCEGDFDGDNDVDGSDLATFAADFGRTDCPEP